MKYLRSLQYRPAWKGGITFIQGYRYLWKPEHQMACKSGYVAEHRMIMSDLLGRRLRTDEVVHHINHDRTDNRIENLEITNPYLHGKEHNYLGKNRKRPHLYSGRCSVRGCKELGGHITKLCCRHRKAKYWRDKNGK